MIGARKIKINSETLTYFLLFFGYYKVLFYGYSNLLSVVQLGLIVFSVVYIFFKGVHVYANKSDKIVFFVVTLVFFISVAVSKIYSVSSVYSREKINELVMTIIYMLLLSFLAQAIDVSKFLKILYKINYFIIILYIILYFRDIITGIDERYGAADTGNPIWISRFCLETVLTMFLLDFKSKRFSMKRVSKYFIPIFVSIRLGSKGPWVAFLMSLLFFAVVILGGRNVELRLKKSSKGVLGYL